MASLENRSSLRKLEFPSCSREALRRMHASFWAAATKGSSASGSLSSSATSFAGAVSGGSTALLMSPKETELVLDIIDEFIFFTKPSLSKSKRLNSIQELQLMEVLIDFFQSNSAPSGLAVPEYNLDPAMVVLSNIFSYLFTEPSWMKDDVQESARTRSLAKLTSVALGLKNRPVLHCLGVWMHRQGALSRKCLGLSESVISDFILLVPDPQDCLKNLPVIAPLFAAHLMTAATEIYSFPEPTASLRSSSSSLGARGKTGGGGKPPLVLVELFNCFLRNSAPENGDLDAERLLVPAMAPAMTCSAPLFTSPQQYSAQQVLTPVVGLARWSVLYPVHTRNKGTPAEKDAFSRLQVGILECLWAMAKNRALVREDVVPVKNLAAMVTSVSAVVQDYLVKSCGDQQQQQQQQHLGDPLSAQCLDRLAQFLHCLAAASCVFGKSGDLLNAIRSLPEHQLLKSYAKQCC